MARSTKSLTATQIDKAKPKDKEYNLADGFGLYLRIRPSGKKTWLFKYQKPFTKKRTNLSLGPYPAISLAEVRKKRTEMQAFLAKKIDPQQAKKEKAPTKTISSVVADWMKIKRSKVTKDYADDIKRSLDNHVLKYIGDVRIDQIEAQMVISLLKPIELRGSLETIKRLCQRLNEVMIFAVNAGLIKHNNLAGIKHTFKTPNKKNLPALSPKDLPFFLQKLGFANIKSITRYLILFQLHTMTRPSEAAGASWSEIDFDKKLWTIPAERMKKRKEHPIPLSCLVLTLLEQLKPYSYHLNYLFPADRDLTKHTNAQTANMAIKRMGFGGQLVSHGLRSIASTALNESGLFEPDLIEAALAHVSGSEVRRAYNRAKYIERRRQMMEWWSEFVEGK